MSYGPSFHHRPSVAIDATAPWFAYARAQAAEVGGEPLIAALAVADGYLGRADGGAVDFNLTQVQSDTAALSSLVAYLGMLAATSKMRALAAKSALEREEINTSRRFLAEAAGRGEKLTKTQADVDARMECVAHEDAHRQRQFEADVFANACVSIQELVNTLKKIGDRMIREMGLHPEVA